MTITGCLLTHVEHKHAALSWNHWKRSNISTHLYHFSAKGTCGVDHGTGVHRCTIAQMEAFNATARHTEALHRLFNKLNSSCHCCFAHGLQQRPGIKVSLITLTKGPQGHAIGAEPGEPGVELPGIHQTNPRGTSRVLHRVVFSEDCLSFWCGQQQVAMLLELHVSIYVHSLAQLLEALLQEIDAVERQRHIHRQRELLSDPPGRAGRRSARIGGVGFEDHDALLS
mmetsp:Transcript_62789/g.137513  ORF Transcript_62789/g.137513 Transcript_62789/m.137513 type:complete len:226 (-) Transcript_62789:214-891(-)